MISDPIRLPLLMLALVAAIAIVPLAPEAGNTIYLASAGLGLLLLRRRHLPLLWRPLVWMPLAALLLLAIAFVAATGSIQGAAGVLYFAPFLSILPLLALSTANEGPDGRLLAMFALCGVSGATLAAIGDVNAGSLRAGLTVANAIHFADVALMAGFLATLGMLYTKGAWRLFYLLGPALAVVAVTLSGTRGALVAGVAMLLVSLVLVAWFRLVSLRLFALAILALALVTALALLAGLGQTLGVQRIMLDIADVMRSGLPTDASTTLRLQMYQGGYQAFLASPIFGHGPFDYVAAAAVHFPALAEGVPHLHNDIADFAASGGVIGLLAYALLLLAPLADAICAPPSQNRKAIIVLAAAVTAGYFTMGLTNAVFGILAVTIYFTAITVVLGLAANGSGSNSATAP